MRRGIGWLAAAGLVLGGAARASTVAAGRAPAAVRKVRAIVARVVPDPGGAPTSVAHLMVLGDEMPTAVKGRWIRLRLPGRRDGDRVVAAPGFPRPARGDWVILTLRQKAGADWLLSRPEDYRPYDPWGRP